MSIQQMFSKISKKAYYTEQLLKDFRKNEIKLYQFTYILNILRQDNDIN